MINVEILEDRAVFSGTSDEIMSLEERIEQLGIRCVSSAYKGGEGVIWVPTNQGEDNGALDREMWLADIISEYK